MCGAADQLGTCQPRPGQCPPVDGLYCACDGHEYESECAAAAAGTDVAHPGPCEGPVCDEGACGGPPPVAACPDGSVPPMSCEAAPGGCAWNIGPCPDPGECGEGACGGPPPVAACPDGSPMPIVCERDARGECGWTVLPCPGEGVACGGFLGSTCAADEFCDFAGDGCDFADASGLCQPRPEACQEIFAPVCGCDGQTYDNLCMAQAAGIDAAAIGACGP